MIIGLSGVANSGKDFFAKMFIKHGYVIISMADPVKRIAQHVYAFTDEQLWGPSHNRNIPDKRYPKKVSSYYTEYLTPREALQKLGTDWGRGCYVDTWVDLVIRNAKQILGGGYGYTPQKGIFELEKGMVKNNVKGIIIPDVRFKNEFAALKAENAKLFRIQRPGSGLKGEQGQHISEVEQSMIRDEEFDGVILNDKDKSFLEGIANDIINRQIFA